MAKIKLFNSAGASAGEGAISDKLATLKVNQNLIWEVIKAEQANARQGTHKTKTKGEVSGGGKKPWKQKGTGRARQGSTRSPQWRHGGIVFGPQPRDYTDAMPRKKKALGLAHIIANKIQQNKLFVFDGLNLEKPSTKSAFQIFDKITNAAGVAKKSDKKKIRAGAPDNRATITVIASDLKDSKSLRNIPWIQCIHVDRISAQPLHYNSAIIASKAAIEAIDKKYSALV